MARAPLTHVECCSMKRALVYLFLISCLAAATVTAQDNSSKSTAPTTTSKDQTQTATSAADIAAAKAAHKVWVNLDTGIFHKGGRWYGKTKNGKFMTEDDAKKAGYQAAKRD
jgi:hypothetical protein